MNRSVTKIGILLSVVILLWGCTGTSEKKSEATTEEARQTYTCPMHPQVIKHEMSTCPICGMDLVPFEKNSADKSVKLDEQRQLLANIATIRVSSEGIVLPQKALNGRLVLNPEHSNYISAKIAGRIEQLYIRETGVAVKKGEPLYVLYSEQLATLQQEYLMIAAQQQQFAGDKLEQQLLASARQKLLLYGQTEQQIQQLAKTRQKSPLVTVLAPQSGTVAELSITQGQYVAEGGSIMRLENYGQLWVEADLYPNEAKQIRKGQRLKIIITGWEDQEQWMKVDFINPSLQSGTQLTQIRGSIPNPKQQWQPGLQVQVLLTNVQESAEEIILPVDAVINDAKGQHVWIKTGTDSFEPKPVVTGVTNQDQVSITSGLEAGEEVVITGAYLLFSEYVLKRGMHPLG